MNAICAISALFTRKNPDWNSPGDNYQFVYIQHVRIIFGWECHPFTIDINHRQMWMDYSQSLKVCNTFQRVPCFRSALIKDHIGMGLPSPFCILPTDWASMLENCSTQKCAQLIHGMLIYTTAFPITSQKQSSLKTRKTACDNVPQSQRVVC